MLRSPSGTPRAGGATAAALAAAAMLVGAAAFVRWRLVLPPSELPRSSTSEAHSPAPPGPAPAPLRPLVFMAIGDWGRGGSELQRDVAGHMLRIARAENASFILSLGDNFYDNGVTGLGDHMFAAAFEDIYFSADAPAGQGLPWYLALGDHDHCGSVAAQVQYTKRSQGRWHMPAPYFSVRLGGSGTVSADFVVTDSVGLEGYAAGDTERERRFRDRLDPAYTSPRAGEQQLRWLQRKLRGTGADWVIAVGHRPVVTAGMRPRTPSESRTAAMLQRELRSANVPVYMNGHDHTAQHLFDGGTHYIVNGGGGYDGLHDVRSSAEEPRLRWGASTHGFCLCRIVSRELMQVLFYSETGELLHEAELIRPAAPPR